MKKLKVLELFGGISAPHKALLNLGINVETIDYIEFDPKVVEIRNAIYNTNFEAKSVVGYTCNKEVDILIGGSPCQDFSNAGTNKGGDINSGTRSSLMWEQLRIIEETRPKITIWENVKSVLGKRHKHNFEMYQTKLEELGYTNYYKVLNSVNFGIPQNRERVFLVSIRNDINITFNFDNLITQELQSLTNFVDFNDLSNGEVCIPQATKQGYIKGITPLVFDGSFPKSKTRRGRVQTVGAENVTPTITCTSTLVKLTLSDIERISNWSAYEKPLDKIMNENSIVNTITTRSCYNTSSMKLITDFEKLASLGPLECFRLMGFSDEDYTKASSVGSKTKLHHVAGNSIVVPVLEAIFKELLKDHNI